MCWPSRGCGRARPRVSKPRALLARTAVPLTESPCGATVTVSPGKASTSFPTGVVPPGQVPRQMYHHDRAKAPTSGRRHARTTEPRTRVRSIRGIARVIRTNAIWVRSSATSNGRREEKYSRSGERSTVSRRSSASTSPACVQTGEVRRRWRALTGAWLTRVCDDGVFGRRGCLEGHDPRLRRVQACAAHLTNLGGEAQPRINPASTEGRH